MPEALDGTGAIQPSRLVQVSRNGLNPAQEHQHIEADELPGAQRRDARQRLVGALQERLRGQTDRQQYCVVQARFCVQEFPYGRHDDKRGDHRQKVCGAEEPKRAYAVLDQQGEGEAEDHLGRHADERVEP